MAVARMSRGAHLGSGGLDFERDGVCIVVGDLKRPLNGLSERPCTVTQEDIKAKEGEGSGGATFGGIRERMVEPKGMHAVWI